MNEHGPKITIGQDDLPGAPAPPPTPDLLPERLVLVPVPIPAEPSSEEEQAALPDLGEAGLPTLLSLVLISFVPFVNAWYWARVARRLSALAWVGWAMALFLGAGSLALAVVLACFLAGAGGNLRARPAERPAAPEPQDWLERLAEQQGSSVVVVHAAGGTGTGFVVASEEGRHLLLTNRHVLAGGTHRPQAVPLNAPCRIQLRDRTEYPAAVVGVPAADDLDLTLLEARVPGLAPLGPVAEFAEVRQGERVAAVGHPLGLDFTITDGIVSAKRDELYLQTTAPISPGNSGGPLVSARGKVLGVCTLLLGPRAGQPIGLALRADFVLSPRHWQLRDADVKRLMTTIPR